jgi:hypothetical protein
LFSGLYTFEKILKLFPQPLSDIFLTSISNFKVETLNLSILFCSFKFIIHELIK